MRLVVAGATGRHIVGQALRAGHQVTALVRRDSGFEKYPRLLVAYANVVDDDTQLRHGPRAGRPRSPRLGTIKNR